MGTLTLPGWSSANYATYIVAVLSAASHYEVGPICDVRLDCAHSYKFGVIGSLDL